MAEVTGGLILLAIGAYFALPFRLSESMIEWLGPVLLIIVGSPAKRSIACVGV